MITNAARLGDPSRSWVFDDPYIRATIEAQVSRILKGALAELPEYPVADGVREGLPHLKREVVVLADGSPWLYGDDSTAPIHTAGDNDGTRSRDDILDVLGHGTELVREQMV